MGTTLMLPWAWRLRKAESADERFFVGFLDRQTAAPFAQAWRCDGIARTEDEAREYARQYGVSSGAFEESLKHLRQPAERTLFL